MKGIKWIIYVFFCLLGYIVQANPIERLILKNGSVLEGYISKQRPGKDFVFTSQRADIYLPAKGVRTIDHMVDLKHVSPEWKQWAKENEVIRNSGNQNSIILSDIIPLANKEKKQEADEMQDISNVRILEKGVTIKYLDLSPRTYLLNWDTVQVIKRDKRSKTDLSGLNDVIRLKAFQEELEGQIIEQVPGELIRLLKVDGMVEVIEQKQIAKQKKKMVNPNQSLFEQSQLLDIIQTKDGSSIEGIIIEQDFGVGNEESYLLLETSSGKIERIKHKNVVETRKEKNPAYKMVSDVILRNDALMINRKLTTDALLEEIDDVITILPESNPVVLKLDSIEQRLIIELPFNDKYEDPILLKIEQKTINKKDSQNGFTYKDIVTNSISYTSKETSVNNTIKLVYHLNQTGYYVVYLAKNKRTILCLVK